MQKIILIFLLKQNLTKLLQFYLKNIPQKNLLKTSDILFWAMDNNIKEDTINILFQFKFNFNITDHEGKNLIIYWIQNNYSPKILKKIIEKKVNINQCNKNGIFPLCYAIQENNDKLSELLKYKPNIHQKDSNGNNALFYAFYKDNLKGALLLINAGCEINILNKSKKGCLHLALENQCSPATIKELLLVGASPYLQRINNIINISYIKKTLCLTTKELNKWYQQEILNFQTNENEINFILDIFQNPSWKSILNQIKDINTTSLQGMSLLMVAAKHPTKEEIVQYLQIRKISTQLKDKDGKTAFEYFLDNFEEKNYDKWKKICKPSNIQIETNFINAIHKKQISIIEYMLENEAISTLIFSSPKLIKGAEQINSVSLWKKILKNNNIKTLQNITHTNHDINTLIKLCRDSSQIKSTYENIANTILSCIKTEYISLNHAYRKYCSEIPHNKKWNNLDWNNKLKEFSYEILNSKLHNISIPETGFYILPNIETKTEFNKQKKNISLSFMYKGKIINYNKDFILTHFQKDVEFIFENIKNWHKNYIHVDNCFKLYNSYKNEIMNDFNGNPYDFETRCASILNKNGFSATTTPQSGDQGVDVIAQYNDKTIALQCKMYKHPVGNKAVQEIHSGQKYYNADYGCIVTTSSYTSSAYNLAQSCNIVLLHISELESLKEILRI